MTNVSTLLYYSAPLEPAGRDDDWCIDAVSQSPKVHLNFRVVGVEATVTDLRNGALSPGLDRTGFEKLVSPTRVDHHALAAKSDSSLERYRSELSELLTALTGADLVRFFDVTVRRQEDGRVKGSPSQAPHQRVHVDQSPKSALARAARHGEPGRRFSRVQIVNAWRPLFGPVRNYPLAVCDYRSLHVSADLVPTRLLFPDWLKDRETFSVKHNPDHRWYYWNGMSPDEVLVFKCYDSASRSLASPAEGPEHSDLIDVAGLCPHTAFFDDGGPVDGTLRTSVEMRALLFYD
ncbi:MULTISPECIES: CmcJ/NvfI family oxidoreductase [unclassified Streptomyces]|uniref:CmcJ/NvfI family oxidoreductase n=1 Tax=unclassified Streptomyces TaxID=2593676 RepID=UPI00234B4563|nr:CmcJ/NvfI family oxidoreductase [Streptomyces sp. M92]WCN03353.1 7-alpha-cephem-methoxylase [Streptomyces sp. M92]